MSDTPAFPDGGRPRFRVPAGSSAERLGSLTTDSVANFVARLGISTPNLLSSTSYTFTPISRMQQLMEWSYRGSWIIGAAVDSVADDMTRAGVEMNSETPPDEIEELNAAMDELEYWQRLNECIKWSRLYGGALMVPQIDGQDMETPLRLETVGKDQLKGFMVLDRWMLSPTYQNPVLEYGPDYGLPEYYDVVATAPFMPRQRIHYTRCVRIDGVVLPFRQRLAENGWGMSVVERLYDRLLAFDSGTLGAAQLLYKAYLRTYKVEGFRQMMGANGELQERFMRQMDAVRMLQSNEGLTVIDMKDEFETHAYSFSGIPETLLILGQQIGGALGIPLVRLFGQSPAGQNATGDSDWRLYETMIKATQEARLRRPQTRMFELLWRSVLGREPPPEWGYKWRPIRELNEMEKAEVSQRDAATIAQLHQGGIITTAIALKELKQSSILTGRFTNITEEDIASAEEQPAPWDQEAQQEQMDEEREHQMALAKETGIPPGMGGGKPPGMPGGGAPGGAGGPPGKGGGGIPGAKIGLPTLSSSQGEGGTPKARDHASVLQLRREWLVK